MATLDAFLLSLKLGEEPPCSPEMEQQHASSCGQELQGVCTMTSNESSHCCRAPFIRCSPWLDQDELMNWSWQNLRPAGQICFLFCQLLSSTGEVFSFGLWWMHFLVWLARQIKSTGGIRTLLQSMAKLPLISAEPEFHRKRFFSRPALLPSVLSAGGNIYFSSELQKSSVSKHKVFIQKAVTALRRVFWLEAR